MFQELKILKNQQYTVTTSIFVSLFQRLDWPVMVQESLIKKFPIISHVMYSIILKKN